MIKILKISAIVTIVIALGSAALLAGEFLRDKGKSPEILSKAGVVENFKKSRSSSNAGSQTESPLVTQAKLFALGINPPPPPPIPKKDKPDPPKNEDVVVKSDTFRPPPDPPIRPTGKFKLLATAYYPNNPNKSLALLDRTSLGMKWYGPGDQIDHQTVKEVLQNSIVMAQGGQAVQTISMEKEPKSTVRPLLKSDAEAAGFVSRAVDPLGKITGTASSTSSSTTMPLLSSPGGRSRIPATPKPSATRNVTSRSTSTRTSVPSRSTSRYRKPVKVPTADERKKSIDNNISDVKKLMGDQNSGLPSDKKAEEMKAWQELLKILEQERGEVKETPPAK